MPIGSVATLSSAAPVPCAVRKLTNGISSELGFYVLVKLHPPQFNMEPETMMVAKFGPSPFQEMADFLVNHSLNFRGVEI